MGGVNNKTSQRLQILSQDEMTELYAVPQFNATERSHFFLLPEKVLHSLKIMKTNGRSTSTKLWFILQHGYFKAMHQFFNIHFSDVKDDVIFIMRHYLFNDHAPHQPPSRRIQGILKGRILQLAGYSDNMKNAGQLVTEKVTHFAKVTHSVREIYSESISYLG